MTTTKQKAIALVRGRPIAATYARVSTEEQIDNNSLPSQDRAMRKLASDKGYTVPAEFVFVDPGFSGSELDRPALTKLREVARARLIDIVLVYDLDRLSRSLSHQMLLIDELERHGVRLEVVNGGELSATPEGKMLTQMRGVFAEFERSKIKERVTRGRRERALSGRPVASAPPYGYRFNNGEMEIIEREAVIVRRMFRLAAANTPVCRIARILNEEGIKPRRAAAWSTGVCGGILRNATYMGERPFNKSERCEPVRRRRPKQPGKSPLTSQRPTPETAWILTRCDAIVPAEQFEQVRVRLERTRQLHVGRPSTTHPLRGLLRCERCGSSVRSYNSHGRTYFRCNKLVSGRLACRARKIPTERVERAVWTKFCETIEAPLTILDQLNGGPRKNKNASAERVQVERGLERLRQRERRVALGLVNADNLASEESLMLFRDELRQIASRRNALQSQLATLGPTYALPDPAAYLRRWALRTRRNLAASVGKELSRGFALVNLPAEHRRNVLVEHLRSVRLSAEHVELDFQIFGGAGANCECSSSNTHRPVSAQLLA